MTHKNAYTEVLSHKLCAVLYRQAQTWYKYAEYYEPNYDLILPISNFNTFNVVTIPVHRFDAGFKKVGNTISYLLSLRDTFIC